MQTSGPITFQEQDESANLSLADSHLDVAVHQFGARHLLSDRERRALGCAVRGLAEKQAADELGCARTTIATYWQRIYRKVGIRGQRAIVAELLRELLTAAPTRKF